MSKENDWEQFKKTGSVNDYLKFNDCSNNADEYGSDNCSGDGCDCDGCDCENPDHSDAMGGVDLNSNSYDQNNAGRNCFDSYDEFDYEDEEAFDEDEE